MLAKTIDLNGTFTITPEGAARLREWLRECDNERRIRLTAANGVTAEGVGQFDGNTIRVVQWDGEAAAAMVVGEFARAFHAGFDEAMVLWDVASRKVR